MGRLLPACSAFTNPPSSSELRHWSRIDPESKTLCMPKPEIDSMQLTISHKHYSTTSFLLTTGNCEAIAIAIN